MRGPERARNSGWTGFRGMIREGRGRFPFGPRRRPAMAARQGVGGGCSIRPAAARPAGGCSTSPSPQYVHLSQLRADLFRLMALSRHFGAPVCLKTYLRVDQFIGGEKESRAVGSRACPDRGAFAGGKPSRRWVMPERARHQWRSRAERTLIDERGGRRVRRAPLTRFRRSDPPPPGWSDTLF